MNVTNLLPTEGQEMKNGLEWRQAVFSHVDSTPVSHHTSIVFIRSSERVLENAVWDVVDYHFTVTKGSESCEIAVGIPGDWQDRMSQPLLRKLAETWLMHRLEHGYEPFGEPPHCRRIMQVPFSMADYWYLHGRFPH